MSANTPGLLIVFEGTDGTGKSTQLRLLASALEERGFPVISTCEPSNGKFGKEIRALFSKRDTITPEEELELFLADRKDHVESLIAPEIKSGKIVLCDRYYLSTIAYQGAAGLNPADILARNDFAPEPDLAILFHVPLATGIKRITESRGEALNDFEKKEYLQKVATQFERLRLPCIQRVDASKEINAVHQDVLALVNPLLSSL